MCMCESPRHSFPHPMSVRPLCNYQFCQKKVLQEALCLWRIFLRLSVAHCFQLYVSLSSAPSSPFSLLKARSRVRDIKTEQFPNQPSVHTQLPLLHNRHIAGCCVSDVTADHSSQPRHAFLSPNTHTQYAHVTYQPNRLSVTIMSFWPSYRYRQTYRRLLIFAVVVESFHMFCGVIA